MSLQAHLSLDGELRKLEFAETWARRILSRCRNGRASFDSNLVRNLILIYCIAWTLHVPASISTMFNTLGQYVVHDFRLFKSLGFLIFGLRHLLINDPLLEGLITDLNPILF